MMRRTRRPLALGPHATRSPSCAGTEDHTKHPKDHTVERAPGRPATLRQLPPLFVSRCVPGQHIMSGIGGYGLQKSRRLRSSLLTHIRHLKARTTLPSSRNAPAIIIRLRCQVIESLFSFLIQTPARNDRKQECASTPLQYVFDSSPASQAVQQPFFAACYEHLYGQRGMSTGIPSSMESVAAAAMAVLSRAMTME